MPNYQNGKIYKISSPCGLTYYGSTTQALCRRISKHKTDIKIGRNPSSATVIEAGGVISLIELYPCNSKEELESRERFYIDNNECVNNRIPNRTHKEWRIANNGHLKEYANKYRQQNKNKTLEYAKKYHKQNKQLINEKQKQPYICYCGGRYTYSGRARHFKTIKHRIYLLDTHNCLNHLVMS